jgi:thioredoxin
MARFIYLEPIMATVDLTKDNFEHYITTNDIVIVDFWAPWCGPCQSFAPVYEAVSEKHPDVVFAKINSEEEQEVSGYFQIRSIPTLMVFREKVVLFTQSGALQASQLEELIAKIKEIDMIQVHKDIAEQDEQAS